MQRLDAGTDRLALAGNFYFESRLGRLHILWAALRRPTDLVRHAAQTLDQFAKRLQGAIRPLVRDAARRLDGQAKLLDSLSYKGVLARGYALVRDARGRPVFRAADAVPGADIEIEFTDGLVGATLGGAAPKPGKGRFTRKPGAKKRSRGGGGDDSQGQLL